MSRRPGTPGWMLVAGLCALLLSAAAALVATGVLPFGGDRATPAGRQSTTAAGTGPISDPARYFLDRYVRADGRVSRLDQGGDTVSEGQAYALMLSVATGDESRFDRVWTWTRSNLLRDDGLLSWTWSEGAIKDSQSASDADLDTAHALVAAGDLFDRDDLSAAGRSMGFAVLDHETVATPLGRILTAGSWAQDKPWQVNPSYGSPAAVAYLAAVAPDKRWDQLAKGDRAVLTTLLAKSALPPDWAQVTADGKVQAMPSPAGSADAGAVRFGLDAARITIRAGAGCDRADRAVAADLDGVLARPADQVRGTYDLGGKAVVGWRHPVQLVAAAAAAGSSGDRAGAETLLDAAQTLAEQQPTYYGWAWAALGRALLEQRSALAPPGCSLPPAIPPAAAPAGGATSAGGASAGGSAAGVGSAVPAGTGRSATAVPAEVPVTLRIPSIDVSSSLVELGVADDGTIEVPTDWQRAGWLRTGPAPGERGPAVIAGHVDSRSGPAIFARLHELRAGDTIEVTRRSGTTIEFAVTGTQQVAKDAFPSDRVYGPAPGPVLRLITCGGSFDKASGHYRDNVVVYADIKPAG